MMMPREEAPRRVGGGGSRHSQVKGPEGMAQQVQGASPDKWSRVGKGPGWISWD